MEEIRKLSILMVVSLCMIVLVGCGQSSNEKPANTTETTETTETPAEGDGQTINVFSAVSLTEALDEIKASYDATNNTNIVYNYGGSGTLRQQIEEGAACDVFISAAENHVDTLEEAGELIEGSRVDLLNNVLVLAGKAELEGYEGKDVKDILIDPAIESIAVGEPETVPAGKYASQSFESFGITEEVTDKINYTKDVRQALDFVDTGNTDVACVYKSDSLKLETGKVLGEFPEDSHDPIVYPMALIKDSENQEAAEAFAEYLKTDEAMAIFEKHGFIQAK